MKNQNTLRTCSQLLSCSEEIHKKVSCKKAVFHLQQGDSRDIYNPSVPFSYEGETLLLARVEDRPYQNAEVFFFRKRDDAWEIALDFPHFTMEDPFYCNVNGEHVVGGVVVENEIYHTVFMKAPENDLKSLKMFARGPQKMKDIRLLSLDTDRIAVFTRPQTGKCGRGKIGYFEIHSLKELTEKNILDAEILENQFISEEWGGVNQAHLLEDESIGLLSHIACYDSEENRHYYATVFRFFPDDRSFTPMEFLAKRSDFLVGPSKRPDLVDVVFPGGMIRNSDGTATVYAGTSDAETQELILSDPFRKWE